VNNFDLVLSDLDNVSTSRQFLRRFSTAAIVRDRSFFDGIFGGRKRSEETTSRQFLRRSSIDAIVRDWSFSDGIFGGRKRSEEPTTRRDRQGSVIF
jgi:hypothetical protein